MRSELERQLRGDEDARSCVYQDHLGFWTIGIGRLVDSRKTKQGLRPVEMSFMLQNDIDDRIDQLTRRLSWFWKLDNTRQGVLLNMSFQLGVTGLLGFTTTLKRVELGQYDLAAHSMMQSLWAKQTPARAQRMADQMRTGLWQYAKGT